MLYNEEDLILVDDLFAEKKQLSMERDLCAEFYNVMLSYANKNIDNPEKYKYYLKSLVVTTVVNAHLRSLLNTKYFN